MAFCDKFKSVIQILNCSNLEIAKTSDLDASLISRLKSGVRVPARNSIQLSKLVEGIYIIATKNGKIDEIKRLCSFVHGIEDSFQDTLILWFCSEDTSTEVKEERVTEEKRRLLGNNLMNLMNVLQITNMQLAKEMSVDPSLISKYRNGVRVPTANTLAANNIITGIVKKAYKDEKQKRLAAYLHLKQGNFSRTDLQAAVFHYLFKENEVGYAIGNFLEGLGGMENYAHSDCPTIAYDINEDIIKDSSIYYFGKEGFKKAFERFLTQIMVQETPRDIYMYSDQDLEWLMDDTEFRYKWYALIANILKNGNRIKVIHNIEKGIHQAFEGIELWLPLYLTGKVEPYFCKRSCDSRFHHTLYIAEGLAAMSTCFVHKKIDDAIYNYTNRYEFIRRFQSNFSGLMEMSAPLAKVFTLESIKKHIYNFNKVLKQKGEIIALVSSPSVATMPESLVQKIMNRHQFDEEHKRTIMRYYMVLKKFLFHSFKSTKVTEYVCVPSSEEIIQNKIPIRAYGYITNHKIYYTLDEYKEHLRHIKYLSGKYKNYIFCPISSSPFRNLDIYYKKNGLVWISKSEQPTLTFEFEHSMVVEAFEKYLEGCDMQPDTESIWEKI